MSFQQLRRETKATSYHEIDVKIIIKGIALAMIHRLFPDGIPTSVNEYAKKVKVTPSTFTRAADWLLGLLPGLLQDRRPGPAATPPPEVSETEALREEAKQKLDDLRKWLKSRSKTPQNACYDGEAKRRIADVAEEIRAGKTLTYEEIAGELGMDPRQLSRIRKEVTAAGGNAPEKKSTRPKTSPSRTSSAIQALIVRIEASADTRHPYGPVDIKRIMEKNYKAFLEKHHGSPTISLDTVSKYMRRSPQDLEPEDHPRGSYEYPEPFQAVALDTSYFKVFGVIYYIITALDMGGRLNLVTRIFLREDTEAVVSVIEEFLSRYPGIQVAVIDRGSPYLNDEVRALLESHGLFRLVCPPEAPTAKAAIERHFNVLKPFIRQAVEGVFPQDPGWSRHHMAKALEIAVAVFARMYHLIPQEYIDGKSPAERTEDFDPTRAAARQAALFQHALRNEPSDAYARHFHRFFQLPWEEKKTVGALRQFPTRVLMQLLEQEKKNLGPPLPITIEDPLGYLAARAREIYNKITTEFFAEKWREAEAAKKAKQQEQELREDQENPEAQVDGMLRTLILSVRNGHGVRRTIDFMHALLARMSEKMGSFFDHELSRLKGKVPQLCNHTDVTEQVIAILDTIAAEIAGI